MSYLPYSLSKFYSSASYISVKEAITTKCWQNKNFKSLLSFWLFCRYCLLSLQGRIVGWIKKNICVATLSGFKEEPLKACHLSAKHLGGVVLHACLHTYTCWPYSSKIVPSKDLSCVVLLQTLEDHKTLGDCGFTSSTARAQAPATIGLSYKLDGECPEVAVTGKLRLSCVFCIIIHSCVSAGFLLTKTCFSQNTQ